MLPFTYQVDRRIKYMDINEFITLYIQADDEIRYQIEKILKESQQHSEPED